MELYLPQLREKHCTRRKGMVATKATEHGRYIVIRYYKYSPNLKSWGSKKKRKFEF
jgi:hypothetical protein